MLGAVIFFERYQFFGLKMTAFFEKKSSIAVDVEQATLNQRRWDVV